MGSHNSQKMATRMFGSGEVFVRDCKRTVFKFTSTKVSHATLDTPNHFVLDLRAVKERDGAQSAPSAHRDQLAAATATSTEKMVDTLRMARSEACLEGRSLLVVKQNDP